MNKFPETGVPCLFTNKYGNNVKAETLSNLAAYAWLEAHDHINEAYNENGVLCTNNDTHSWIMYDTEFDDTDVFYTPNYRLIF